MKKLGLRDTISSIMLGICSVLFISCSFARDVRVFHQPVWSDTGSHVLYADLKYSERDVVFSDSSTKWDQRFTLVSDQPSGQVLRSWGPEFQGWPYKLYFMETEGYVLLEWYDGQNEKISIIRSDNSVQTVVPEQRLGTDDLIRAIPNPDGSAIAVIYAEIQCSPGSYSTNCSYESAYGDSFSDPNWYPPHRACLNIIDAATLGTIHEFSRDFNSYLEFRWSASDVSNFVITDTLETSSGSGIYAYRTFSTNGSQGLATDSYGTFAAHPPTSSSVIDDSYNLLSAQGASFSIGTAPSAEWTAFADHRF